MRISSRVRIGVAAAAVVVAAVAGCSTTVDGAATCPGCGIDTEPDFPTSRPTATTPVTPDPRPTTQPPSAGGTLAPDADGLVFIVTRSGLTRCQISADTVGCESEFTDAPTVDGTPATGVEVTSAGDNRWVVGNLGAIPVVPIDYATYNAVGWTINADAGGTRFTNDSTGHGMFVSTGQVDFF